MGWFKRLLGIEDVINENVSRKNIVVTIKDGEIVEEVVGESNDKDFDRLLEAVSYENQDVGRINLIKMSVKMGRKFTCDQVRSLIEEFSQDEHRAKVVIVLYPQLIDKENFIVVLGAFDIGYYKEKVLIALELI